jgi:hypothetical protein
MQWHLASGRFLADIVCYDRTVICEPLLYMWSEILRDNIIYGALVLDIFVYKSKVVGDLFTRHAIVIGSDIAPAGRQQVKEFLLQRSDLFR